MIIIANNGLVVPPTVVTRYGIQITRQHIIADGIDYDPEQLSFADIDRLAATSKEAPHYLGTSAAEYVKLFTDLTKRDRELLIISASRHLSNSHDSAVAAKRTLASLSRPPAPRIDIVETMSIDVAAGLIVAVTADAANHTHSSTATLVDGVSAMAAGAQVLLVPGDVERFTKGGRAAASRPDLDKLGGKKPILGLVDGIVRGLGILDDAAPMRSLAACAVKRVGAGRKVLLAAGHDTDPEQIDEVIELLKRDLDVHATYRTRMGSGMYLNLGPKAVTLGLLPLDAVPWPVGALAL